MSTARSISIESVMTELSSSALDTLFFKARSRNGWQTRPVPEDLLKKIYAASVMGPTATNSQPQRIVFVSTPEAKARLLPIMHEGNRIKVEQAPVIVLFANDLHFHHHLATTFPHATEARSWFEGNEALINTFSMRNGTLQAAYFMLAARAYGLDCGPMSGFEEDAMNDAFMESASWRVNFVCAIGYGSDERLFGRLPRLPFDVACRIV